VHERGAGFLGSARRTDASSDADVDLSRSDPFSDLEFDLGPIDPKPIPFLRDQPNGSIIHIQPKATTV